MRILTGIKPSGILHVGNFFGSIKQLLDYPQEGNEIFAFIANAHALTSPTMHDNYQQYSKSLLAGYLACGIDPEKICIYKQTDIPETFQLSWILNCFCTKGVMDRAHAYKAYQDTHGQDSISIGVYTYPVLMAADILGAGANVVPVGPDQKQHVEICRDLAIKVNHHMDKRDASNCHFTVPDAQICTTQNVIGLDSRKMSKSYNNTISLFEENDTIRKLVYGIKTDSSMPTDPKEKETLFELYSLFASQEEIAALAHKYQTGIGWAEVKKITTEKVQAFIEPIRTKYNDYMQKDQELNEILDHSGRKVRKITQEILQKTMDGIGL